MQVTTTSPVYDANNQAAGAIPVAVVPRQPGQPMQPMQPMQPGQVVYPGQSVYPGQPGQPMIPAAQGVPVGPNGAIDPKFAPIPSQYDPSGPSVSDFGKHLDVLNNCRIAV